MYGDEIRLCGKWVQCANLDRISARILAVDGGSQNE